MLLAPQSSSPAYTSNIPHLPSSIIMYVMFTNYSFVFSILWTLCSFGASFCVRHSFVFNIIQPLLQKYRGVPPNLAQTWPKL
jgi:hypothetical protein